MSDCYWHRITVSHNSSPCLQFILAVDVLFLHSKYNTRATPATHPQRDNRNAVATWVTNERGSGEPALDCGVLSVRQTHEIPTQRGEVERSEEHTSELQ